ncbi:hypothetical protein LTR15_007737 [Elasticomyces elasticus]|nr:hypothetical protein LTR15_007737 [Elasticomyces elasticus]
MEQALAAGAALGRDTSSSLAADGAKSKSSTQNDNPQPPNLLTIPAELRKDICELVFKHSYSVVNLLEASPPSKSLLLTCKEIYYGTRQAYKTAYQSYWRDTQFTLHAYGPSIDRFSEADIASIRHIRLCLDNRRLDGRRLPDSLVHHVDLERHANREWWQTSTGRLPASDKAWMIRVDHIGITIGPAKQRSTEYSGEWYELKSTELASIFESLGAT